ncbi:hypothetical protein V6N12_013803 [Hibiscus sabdariffa]|uniref:Uncharacterized protein n=1 Tax=Hibiscus sabdariffa TaxID=183260 RepID=A0ABR2CVA2_9ROSI
MEWEGGRDGVGEGRIAFGEPRRRLAGITPEHGREPNRRWGVVLRTLMVATRWAMVCEADAPMGRGPLPPGGVRGSSTLGTATARWCARVPHPGLIPSPMLCEAAAP